MVLSTLQPVLTMEQKPIIYMDNTVQQLKDSGSESDSETWAQLFKANDVVS